MNYQRERLIEQLQIVSEEGSERAEDREQFNNQVQYFFSLLGCLAGFGSFWRFPYLFFNNGGSVFLIPYFLMMFLLGAPILHLESVLGQICQASLLRITERLHPKLVGIGFFPAFVALNMSVYYNVILTYAYVFFFKSFQSPLPWTVDKQPDDPLNSRYFQQQILQKTDSINELGGFQPQMLVVYIFSIVVCYLIIKNGVNISGKITVITATLPYLLLVVILINGLFLTGTGKAVLYLLTPDFSRLINPSIWKDAAVQVFFQLSVGTGVATVYASFKNKRTSLRNVALFICIGITVCGILSVFIVYLYIFHFMEESGLQLQQLLLSGPSLAFVVFPQALALLPLPNFWSVLFYFTLVLLGIDSQFGLMEAFSATLQQARHSNASSQTEISARLINCVILCCTGVLFSFGNGFYMLIFLDSFTCNLPIPLICMIESQIFTRIVDYEHIERKMNALTGQMTYPALTRNIKSRLLIVLLLLILGIGLVDQLRFTFTLNYMLGLVGWMITLYPLFVAFMYWQGVEAQLILEELDPQSIFVCKTLQEH